MGKSANLPQTRLTFVLMNKSQTQGSRVSIKILLSLQCVVIWHVSVLQIFSIILFIIWHTNQRVTHLLRHLLLLLLLLESLRIIMRWHLIGHDDQWKESIFFFFFKILTTNLDLFYWTTSYACLILLYIHGENHSSNGKSEKKGFFLFIIILVSDRYKKLTWRKRKIYIRGCSVVCPQ